LRLEESEQNAFNAALETLEEPQKERVMETVTSWMEEGIKQGMRQGLEQGRAEGASTLVVTLLTRRFGSLDQSALEQIRSLPLERLERRLARFQNSARY
jgi:hypothetical protein